MPTRPRFLFPLRYLLIMLTAIGLLPLALLGAWGIHTVSEYQQRDQERLMLDLARAVASAAAATGTRRDFSDASFMVRR